MSCKETTSSTKSSEAASTHPVSSPVTSKELEPIDFMTDITHHQHDLYVALEENSNVETDQKTLVYEGALFKILQTSNSGKYGGAKRLINRYMEQYPNDPRLEFQLGVQLFRLGRFDQAVPYFEKLNTATSKPLKEAAQFFLAATYSGLDKQESANILSIISADTKHAFRARAQAILAAN